VKTKSMALESQMSLREAANIVNAGFAKMKAQVEAIEASSNPLDQLDGEADIAVVGRRATMMNLWAVQVYLFDMGEKCGIEMVALGEGGFTRAMHGPRNTVSLTKSVQKMESLVADLRARDPRAQLID